MAKLSKFSLKGENFDVRIVKAGPSYLVQAYDRSTGELEELKEVEIAKMAGATGVVRDREALRVAKAYALVAHKDLNAI